jgi:beta-lactamase class A
MKLFSLILPFLSIFILTFASQDAIAQKQSLDRTLDSLTARTPGRLGISIISPIFNPEISVRGDQHFPMESVYKFPIALKILDEVDKGKLKLNQKIHFIPSHWPMLTWSPLREKYSTREQDISLNEVLSYTIIYSDNVGCDILLKESGGTDSVNRFIHSLGIIDINFAASEAQMHADWNTQYQNWCTPNAMARLWQLFYERKVVSPKSTALLFKMLEKSEMGEKRIKGMLPTDILVAHKSGTSDTDKSGVTAATNDAGIVLFPSGKYVIMVVFLADDNRDEKQREHTIAEVAKETFDFCLKKY